MENLLDKLFFGLTGIVFAGRIADAPHLIFDPTGAMLHGGRWNSIGQRVIYAAGIYAGALPKWLHAESMARIGGVEKRRVVTFS